jgi:hypothetical protein
MNANGKILIIFFSACFCLNVLYAQTNISANTALYGTLSKTASPYHIKGNIYVPKDSTLIIEAGVQMRFDGKYQMSVYGKIKALGIEGDTIKFYPLDTNNRWKGIRFYGQGKISDSAIFKYCKFYHVDELLHYVDGTLSSLSAANSSNVLYSIFHEGYNNTKMYHFTSTSNLNAWLVGKSFENEVLRRNVVLDSLSNTGDDDDTTSNSAFEVNVPNEYGGFDKIIRNSKRLSAGGATLFVHCDIVPTCGSSMGGSKTVGGWHRSLGWINNQATQINHGGIGWNSWCTDKNYKGRKAHWYFVGSAKAYLMNSVFNDNIESVY